MTECKYNDGIQIRIYSDNKVVAEIICANIFKNKIDFNLLEQIIEDTFYMNNFTFLGLGKIETNQFISKKALKIDILNVIPKYQKMGYGMTLLRRLIKKACQKGYTEIYLNSSPMGRSGLGFKKLMNFYKKFGFELIFNMDDLNALMVKHL